MSAPQVEPEWVEDALENQGYEELMDDVPEENRYYLEREDGHVLVRDTRDSNGGVPYEDLDELADVVEEYRESRFGEFEKYDGSVVIYDREAGSGWIQGDSSHSLDEVV